MHFPFFPIGKLQESYNYREDFIENLMTVSVCFIQKKAFLSCFLLTAVREDID